MAEQIALSVYEPLIPSIRCDFCASRIPADSFDYVYWSGTKWLLSASCGGCHQGTVLSIKLWRRQSGIAVPSEP
ncbi:MAG: hypothetical protein ACXVX9_06145 [Mycobacteriaceae bacterium]